MRLGQQAQIDADKGQEVDQEKDRKKRMEPLPPGGRGGDVLHADQEQGDDIQRPLGDKMRAAFQERIHRVNRGEQGSQYKEPPMIGVKVAPKVKPVLDHVGEQEHREQIRPRACNSLPSPVSTRVIPRASTIEVKTERYGKGSIYRARRCCR